MKIEDLDTQVLSKLIKLAAGISNIELPALLLGALAVLPGLIDESFAGVGVLALYSVVALARGAIRSRREKLIERFQEERTKEHISEEEFDAAIKAINTLTIPGGVRDHQDADGPSKSSSN
jgi:flagellar biosynthesis component FlhA